MRLAITSLLCLFFLPQIAFGADYKNIPLKVGMYSTHRTENSAKCMSVDKDKTYCTCQLNITYPEFKKTSSVTSVLNKNIKQEVESIARSEVLGAVYCGSEVKPVQRNAVANQYIWFGLNKIGYENDRLLFLDFLEGAKSRNGATTNYSGGIPRTIIFDKRTGKKLDSSSIFGASINGLNDYIYEELKKDTGLCEEKYSSYCEARQFVSNDGQSRTKYSIKESGVWIDLWLLQTKSVLIPARFIAHPEIKKLAKETPDA